MIKGGVTAQPQAFIAAVKWAAKFISARPAVPMQGGLLLDIEAGRISIVGYNETVTARAVVEVEGDGTGQAVVSGRLLAALAATFPNKPVFISGNTGGDPLITITVGSWRGTLPIMTEGRFPSPPAPPPAIGRVAGDEIAQAVRQVAVARSDNEKQAAIYHCLHLSFGEHQLTALATNMYRAARTTIGFDPEVDAAGRTVLVDGGTLADVAESFAGPDQIWVGLNDTALGLASPTRAVIMRTSAEEYTVLEPIRNVFAAQLPEHARVRSAELQVPLKRAQLVQEKDGPIRVTFGEGQISLTASSETLRQDSDERIAAHYTGPEHTLAFNPHYFAEALASAPGEIVDIALRTDKAAGILLTVPGNDDWCHALMPIRK